ncbi:Homocysteine S-methyltransferase [Roridomyces roridus]|uniref:Homocysteine S-methyltransferase n=1 Tax=Roridomyces roridus TaxID=1738132 RepID=A0AAD7FZG3_9AGAR|nr:Homocysteine S-methyltransferase [Roridomyces roridus]
MPPLPLFHSESEATDLAILDGGLGTTLEQTFGLDISHTPLWSAKAAIEHPEVVVDAHLGWLRARAQVISTSTYQCSLSTFQKAGYSTPDAYKIMVKCVQLAIEARKRFLAEREGNTNPKSIKIALSLGPFGAGLSPAQEFDGFYPPPYGPRAYTPENDNCNAFPADEEGRKEEAEATEALARYHLERLCVFADDEEVWDAIDCIAFETVPLVREIRAIRMAMASLEGRTARKMKPWWISFVFPGGRFPEDGGRVGVRDVVAAAMGDDALPAPSAIGINCTEMESIPALVANMETALQGLAPQTRPWLVLYPNGGDTYDPVSQTWVVNEKGGIWGERFAKIVLGIQRGGTWAGIAAGGCCRTRPEDISLLSRLLQSNE